VPTRRYQDPLAIAVAMALPLLRCRFRWRATPERREAIPTSDVWVESQPRPGKAVALSCVWKSSGGRGGNSPLVTWQVTTDDIQTGGGKLPPRVSGRVGDE